MLNDFINFLIVLIRSSSDEELISHRLAAAKRTEAEKLEQAEPLVGLDPDVSGSSSPGPIKLIIKKNQITEPVEPERIPVSQFVQQLHHDRLFQKPFVEIKPLSARKIERRTKRSVEESYKDAGVSMLGAQGEQTNAKDVLENAPLLELVSKPGPKSFHCSLCEEVFDRQEDRHTHYLKHIEKPRTPAGRTQLLCSICHEQFDNYNERHEHYLSGKCKKQISTEAKKLKCAFCGDLFKDTEERSKHYLKDHLQKGDVSRSSHEGVDAINHSPPDSIPKVREPVKYFVIYALMGFTHPPPFYGFFGKKGYPHPTPCTKVRID